MRRALRRQLAAFIAAAAKIASPARGARLSVFVSPQLQPDAEYPKREGIRVVQELEDVETAKRAVRTDFGEMVAFLGQRGNSCRTLLVEKTDRCIERSRTGSRSTLLSFPP
jgi:hypothetical protein